MKIFTIIWIMLTAAVALAGDKDKAADLAARGSLALDNGDYANAAKFLDEAIHLYPEAPKLIYSWRARAFAGVGEHKKAIADFSLVIADPTTLSNNRVECLIGLANSHQKVGDDASALADFEMAFKLTPQSPSVLNDFAWFLATTPNDAIRNGDRCLALAQAASNILGEQEPAVLDTIAAGYAAKSDFDSAIKTQEQAVSLSKAESQKEELRHRLEMYRAKKPYIKKRE